ncbi:hypothetical protein C7M84_017780 [Penaeus vannamei]|uniref:Uncharacterized protein n=1 Tax=Penaeus vannamei TaxID=6689 RepID=A0A423SJE1_PENVA|nr:hypothetical protein C7M84_017780 [Penaeus vannamei]
MRVVETGLNLVGRGRFGRRTRLLMAVTSPGRAWERRGGEDIIVTSYGKYAATNNSNFTFNHIKPSQGEGKEGTPGTFFGSMTNTSRQHHLNTRPRAPPLSLYPLLSTVLSPGGIWGDAPLQHTQTCSTPDEPLQHIRATQQTTPLQHALWCNIPNPSQHTLPCNTADDPLQHALCCTIQTPPQHTLPCNTADDPLATRSLLQCNIQHSLRNILLPCKHSRRPPCNTLSAATYQTLRNILSRATQQTTPLQHALCCTIKPSATYSPVQHSRRPPCNIHSLSVQHSRRLPCNTLSAAPTNLTLLQPADDPLATQQHTLPCNTADDPLQHALCCTIPNPAQHTLPCNTADDPLATRSLVHHTKPFATYSPVQHRRRPPCSATQQTTPLQHALSCNIPNPSQHTLPCNTADDPLATRSLRTIPPTYVQQQRPPCNISLPHTNPRNILSRATQQTTPLQHALSCNIPNPSQHTLPCNTADDPLSLCNQPTLRATYSPVQHSRRPLATRSRCTIQNPPQHTLRATQQTTPLQQANDPSNATYSPVHNSRRPPCNILSRQQQTTPCNILSRATQKTTPLQHFSATYSPVHSDLATYSPVQHRRRPFATSRAVQHSDDPLATRSLVQQPFNACNGTQC